ncbi:hypothetical protein HZA97_07170 [Candidatus Woesearchaeota archaeon]|nr:hypothetical protein [Candidatus Woesearchaeota archaeon]
MKKIYKTLINLLGLLLVVSLPLNQVYASSEFSEPLSSNDKAMLKQMLKPVINGISALPYVATALAVLYILYAGIGFVTAGYDTAKKEQSKQAIGLTLVGLAVVFAAPYLVQYLMA